MKTFLFAVGVGVTVYIASQGPPLWVIVICVAIDAASLVDAVKTG
jgi:hypothetical protein